MARAATKSNKRPTGPKPPTKCGNKSASIGPDRTSKLVESLRISREAKKRYTDAIDAYMKEFYPFDKDASADEQWKCVHIRQGLLESTFVILHAHGEFCDEVNEEI